MENTSSIENAEEWNNGDLVDSNNCNFRWTSRNGSGNLLQYLNNRFTDGRIYTEANSHVLLMINNSKNDQEIHSDAFIELYKSQTRYRDMATHLYRTCWWCYRAAWEQCRDQCIVFTGKTGSGKTSTFNRALRYLTASFAAKSKSHAQQLANLQTVLHCFGNVRSHDNSESFRFMELLGIELDFQGIVCGAWVTILPLDRAHAIQGMPTRGGYNIFYALLLGANLRLLKSLKLQRNPNYYANLKNDSPNYSSSDYWKDQFIELKDSLFALDFSENEIQDLFKMLAVILKLGNVVFQTCVNVDGSAGYSLENESELLESADLLGCQDKDDLRHAFTKRPGLRVRDEYVSSPPLTAGDVSEAKRRRDKFCESIWSRICYWLIGKLNDKLKGPTGHVASARKRRIYCLDYAGFDSMNNQKQHLDDLLQNYATERLFCHMMTSEIRQREQSYVDEGLQWNSLLQPMDLTTSLGQIEIMLSSGSFRAPSGAAPCSSNDHCSLPTSSNNVCKSHGFTVVHFFGEVHYDIDMEKENSSTISLLAAKACYDSSTPLARQLFPEEDTKAEFKSQPLSIADQFNASLTSILKVLEDATCTYVVCIKANEKQRTNFFDQESVERQLNCFNIGSLTRLGTLGFMYSFKYEDFLDRYRMLNDFTWPKWKGNSARRGATLILRHGRIPQTLYALGRQRIFLKDTEVLSTLEEWRNDGLNRLATIIQRVYVDWVARTDRRSNLERSQIRIAAYYRAYRQRKRYLRERRSAVIIQAHYRSWKTIQYLLRLSKRLPSESPLSTTWPSIAPKFCQQVDAQLQRLYHEWRCWKYRSNVEQQTYFRMREKLAASLIFLDKKTGYPQTVSHPFRGDYLRIRQNPKWRRLAMETGDEYIVFADLVSKLHRSSGKISRELLIVSTNAVIVMDYRTLNLKYRVQASDLVKISVSPYSDSVAVLHFKNSSLSRRSGDFVFECRHLVEVVAKLYLVVHNATGKPPFVNISSAIFIETGTETIELLFHDRDNDSEERDDWTGCFVNSAPVFPPKTARTSTALHLLSDDGSCSSTSESSGCASTTTSRVKLVKRGNRLEFFV